MLFKWKYFAIPAAIDSLNERFNNYSSYIFHQKKKK